MTWLMAYSFDGAHDHGRSGCSGRRSYYRHVPANLPNGPGCMIFGISYYEYLFIVSFVSVCVGSFLNVVAYRLPKILMNDWRWQAEEFLGIEHGEVEKISLSYPRSACPKCGHKIKSWENVPVISYLFLRAKCSSCRTSISARYPVVEIGTMILSVIAVLA